ncbi:hypothetical protein D3C75_1098130 [compost metagenome]
MHRLGNHQCVQIHHLVFERGIAFAVAGGGANKGDVGRNSLVVEIFLVIDLDQLDEIFFGHFIEFAALLARIDEGTNPDFA